MFCGLWFEPLAGGERSNGCAGEGYPRSIEELTEPSHAAHLLLHLFLQTPVIRHPCQVAWRHHFSGNSSPSSNPSIFLLCFQIFHHLPLSRMVWPRMQIPLWVFKAESRGWETDFPYYPCLSSKRRTCPHLYHYSI